MNADCEANYLRMCQLLPGLIAVAEKAKVQPDRSIAESEMLELQRCIVVELQPEKKALISFDLTEQCRFTSTISIHFDLSELSELPTVQLFGQSASMIVRLYHDVKLAEVIMFSGKRLRLASYEYPNETMFMPDEKQQQNKFLAEWLGLCLQMGAVPQSDAALGFLANYSAVDCTQKNTTLLAVRGAK